MFIVIEGIDGVGKTTLINGIVNYIESLGFSVKCSSDTVSTKVGKAVRELMVSQTEVIHPKAQLMLMTAARVQHLEYVIKPAMAERHVAIVDRYLSSTWAYQVGGFGASEDDFYALCYAPIADTIPDLTLLLDMPVDQARARRISRGSEDALERKEDEFMERVRASFVERVTALGDEGAIIDATQSPSDVLQEACLLIDQLLRRKRADVHPATRRMVQQ